MAKMIMKIQPIWLYKVYKITEIVDGGGYCTRETWIFVDPGGFIVFALTGMMTGGFAPTTGFGGAPLGGPPMHGMTNGGPAMMGSYGE